MTDDSNDTLRVTGVITAPANQRFVAAAIFDEATGKQVGGWLDPKLNYPASFPVGAPEPSSAAVAAWLAGVFDVDMTPDEIAERDAILAGLAAEADSTPPSTLP